MIDSITRSYIRDAIMEDLSFHISSERDMSRFCDMIMKGHSFDDSSNVAIWLREDQEPHYFELRESEFPPGEAMQRMLSPSCKLADGEVQQKIMDEAVLANPYKLADEEVQQNIMESFLKDLNDGSLTDSQIERFCNLMKRGERLRDAFDIVGELSEEQEQLMFKVMAEGCDPPEAWQYVTTDFPSDIEENYEPG